jgi:hypothetical protein
MRTRGSVLLVGLVGILIEVAPLLAHHGYSAYDMTSVQSVKGTVTGYRMVNPHSQLLFDVKDPAGKVEPWVVEAGTVRAMKAAGATTETFKPGETVTIYYYPSLNGAHVGVLHKVEFADGRTFSLGQESRSSGSTP